MEDEPIAHIDLIVENYLNKRQAECEAVVREYMDGVRTPQDFEELKMAILEANSYISLKAGEDEKQFEQTEYHLFYGVGGVFMSQGKEIKDLRGRK